jgi:hypothetical protein
MAKTDMLDILRLKGSVFTFKELSLATTELKPLLLKRRLNYYVKKGELYHIRRGLYAKDKNYNRREVATKIFIPSYISFETVLLEAGVTFQYYSTIFVATYQTKEFICDGQNYAFKKIKDTILTNTAGIEQRDNYFIATPERAMLDILYLNKGYYFDNLGAINFDKVFALLPIYNNKRMVRVVERYFKQYQFDWGLCDCKCLRHTLEQGALCQAKSKDRRACCGRHLSCPT